MENKVNEKDGFVFDRDKLARHLHKFWTTITKNLSTDENISDARKNRWKKAWEEFDNLSAKTKDFFYQWADSMEETKSLLKDDNETTEDIDEVSTSSPATGGKGIATYNTRIGGEIIKREKPKTINFGKTTK